MRFGQSRIVAMQQRKRLRNILKKLKFYSNNAFSLIDVHNEQKFNRNTKILVELVQMWQDLRLKTSEQNQFLGDMFEFFLDNSIKQSEGQYFTPIPITKFIVGCLPLKDKVSNKEEPLNAIDFACGSGHFLTEYAHQIEPIVKDLFPSNDLLEVQNRLKQYYGQTIGIEKEDRLAKIAKVSVQMYGQGEIDILEQDALMVSDKIKEQSFDILVANPPFSVKGFLQNLDERQKDNYQLSSTAESDSNNIHSNCLQDTDSQTNFEQYQDQYFIEKYCQHTGLPLAEYKKLFGVTKETFTRLETLLQANIFAEYRKAFNGSSELKSLKSKKWYKDLADKTKQQTDKTKQQAEENEIFIKHLHKIEKEKLFYFMLAYSNKHKVLIVKSPSEAKKQKQFLGYEWSGSKGNEGIKYNGGDNIYDIITPLFNPNDFEDPSKINTLIRQNFLKQDPNNLENFAEYTDQIHYVDTTELLDFNRIDFTKSLSLNATKQQNIEIETKWPLVKLGDIVEINPSKSEIKNLDPDSIIPFVEMSSVDNAGYIKDKAYKIYRELKKGSYTYFAENDIIIAKITPCMENGKCALVNKLSDESKIGLGSSEFNVIRVSEKYLKSKFLFTLLNRDIIRKDAAKHMTGSSGHRRVPASYYENLSIPLPPPEIQTEIVKECEAIDQESQSAQQTITQAKAEIESKVKDSFENQNNTKGITTKLEKLVDINKFTTNPIENPDTEFTYIDIDSIENGTGKISFDKKILGKNAPSRARRIANKNNVIISTVRPYLKGFSFINMDIDGCIFSTGFAILQAKDEEIISNKYLYICFMYSNDLMNQMESSMGKAAYPSINKADIENFTIPVPPLEEQNQLISEVELLEDKISRAQQTIAQAPQQKQMVLEKHLQ